GWNIVREAYRRKTVDEKTIELLMNSITESTMKQYSYALQDWNKFCSENKYDTFNPEVIQVLQWMTDEYRRGASYGTINIARSALSLI
ncbi:hypothetical protein EAI_11377, partial [Harpegnathos saltator]